MIKAGFSGDKDPRTVSPTVVCPTKNMYKPFGNIQKGYNIGDTTTARIRCLDIQYPIKNGDIINWDHMEMIWEHIFENELHVSPPDHPVLLTISPLCPKLNREKMIEIMFDTFNVPSCYLGNTGVLSLLASGRTTGIAVDSGESVTFTVPVYEGISLSHYIQRVDLGGYDITMFLQDILRERGYIFTTSSEFKIIQDIKEKHCCIGEYCPRERSFFWDSSEIEREHKLPDERKITICDERFRWPELLFQPYLYMENVSSHPSTSFQIHF